MSVCIPVSYAELLDKIAILQIKCRNVEAGACRRNVEAELAALEAARNASLAMDEDAWAFFARLRDVNARLWAVEDGLRACERRGDFGVDFVDLARSVYRLNDERARIKRGLNERLGSALVEEKLYAAY